MSPNMERSKWELYWVAPNLWINDACVEILINGICNATEEDARVYLLRDKPKTTKITILEEE